MKNLLLIPMIIFAISSCNGQKSASPAPTFKVHKTDAEWKKELSPKQYEILRKKGTERSFTGEYVNTFEKGKYVCAACSNVLFLSNAKFHSDCGWPSFDQAIKGSVTYSTDYSFGTTRTEVMCADCGGHLGHVFDDGPKETTGQRFCTNSVSVKFIADK
jgi:peptide-methionine (R)-S-oxide reductase